MEQQITENCVRDLLEVKIHAQQEINCVFSRKKVAAVAFRTTRGNENGVVRERERANTAIQQTHCACILMAGGVQGLLMLSDTMVCLFSTTSLKQMQNRISLAIPVFH